MAPGKKKIKNETSEVSEPLQDYGGEPLTFEKVWAMFQETDRQFKETDQRFKETDKAIKKLAGLFTTQWGKLIEALIAPSCLRLFKERGIDISRTYRNVEVIIEDSETEFDVILANGNEVVVIEVKTTMTPAYVDEFLEKMEKIKMYLPEHRDKKVFAAIAGIRYENSSDKYAMKKGLFVLVNSGENIIRIANKPGFSPVEF